MLNLVQQWSPYSNMLQNAFEAQQQQMLQNAYSQYSQAVKFQMSAICGASTTTMPSPKKKPRRDCPCCGAPWLETCDYCGRED